MTRRRCSDRRFGGEAHHARYTYGEAARRQCHLRPLTDEIPLIARDYGLQVPRFSTRSDAIATAHMAILTYSEFVLQRSKFDRVRLVLPKGGRKPNCRGLYRAFRG